MIGHPEAARAAIIRKSMAKLGNDAIGTVMDMQVVCSSTVTLLNSSSPLHRETDLDFVLVE